MSQFSVLTLPFMQRAVVALVFSSMTLSLLGIVVLVFNLAAVRFALMHMGLLGATVGLATGTDPTMAGLAAITGGAFLLGPVSGQNKTGYWRSQCVFHDRKSGHSLHFVVQSQYTGHGCFFSFYRQRLNAHSYGHVDSTAFRNLRCFGHGHLVLGDKPGLVQS